MKKTTFSEDLANNRMHVTREFAADRERVWQAWTQPELLDQWWAPKPWQAKTKTMQFEEGGYWLYCMMGPKGEKSWAKVNYQRIEAPEKFVALDVFCDEEGTINDDFPKMHWDTTFQSSETGTKVEIEIKFDSPEDLKKIVEMGFKEGLSAAQDNLDALMAA
ncbi:SRPBCC family protein [Salmonirosea aquatica]|uniref:SRPBCC domain-containing protein n=1 Tax=Salmonirosea aquatica TaxID=2654236 RepID=A0A7C9BFD2_9BACT|nr:SRPBCC domain-containing protein [Cytophagaceae bacterium SJW1-29]